jgi:hypothetical protein
MLVPFERASKWYKNQQNRIGIDIDGGIKSIYESLTCCNILIDMNEVSAFIR